MFARSRDTLFHSFCALLLLACLAAPLVAQTRGYQPRACGFDMDRDGNIGEPDDDCNVCDGTPADGDGDADLSQADVIYVSCGGDPTVFDTNHIFYTPGSDHAGCGSPTDPCLTIGYAFSTIADGPHGLLPDDGIDDDREDFVCFRNVCTEENLSPRADGGGVETSYKRLASGSQERLWFLPSDPVMLVGWDSNDNQEYPPFDDADAAILVPPETCPGFPNQPCAEAPLFAEPCEQPNRYCQKVDERAIFLVNHLDYVELAHFEVRDYGRYTLTENSGFFDLHADPNGTRPSESSDYLYIHDIETHDLNRDSNFNSWTSAINSFNWKATHVAFENLSFLGNGHWLVRGGASNGPTDTGPIRWQNLTVELDACKPPPATLCDRDLDPSCPVGDVCQASSGCEPGPTETCETRASTSWKMWGYFKDLEILDSVLDTRVAQSPNPVLDGRARAIDAAQCTQGWTIRNNSLIGFSSPIELVGAKNGSCDGEKLADGITIDKLYARPVTDIVIDRNTIHYPAPTGVLDAGILIRPGGDRFPNQVVGDVTISNNMISSNDGLENCIFVEAGHDWDESDPAYPIEPVPGAIKIFNNTCYGPFTVSAIAIGDLSNPNQDTMQEDFVVRNNVVGGKSALASNIATSYAPTTFDAGGNVWDLDGGFRWNDPADNRIDLAAWETASGDTGSRQCLPAMATTSGTYGNGDPAAVDGDLHLSPIDTCAQGNGSDLSLVTSLPSTMATTDFDTDTRPQSGAWDAGADEVAPRPLDQPPLRYAEAPSGVQLFGTTSVTVELRTDQDADCSWATSAGVPYGHTSRTLFTSTGATLHSFAESGLANGDARSFYVRCENTMAIANGDDLEISFSVADLEIGQVARWSFDEATGCTAADSGGTTAYDGTHEPSCPGNSPAVVAGQLGNALDFDGSNDYVEVAHASELAFTSSFTAAAWIRPDDFGDNKYGRIVAKQKYVGGFGTGWSFYLGDVASGNPAGIKTLCANISTTDFGCGSNNAITLGTWQHVAMVFDDTLDTVTFYVDGVAAGSYTANAALGTTTVPLRIGDRDDLKRSFDGTIDDVRLWDRALTAAEVQELATIP